MGGRVDYCSRIYVYIYLYVYVFSHVKYYIDINVFFLHVHIYSQLERHFETVCTYTHKNDVFINMHSINCTYTQFEVTGRLYSRYIMVSGIDLAEIFGNQLGDLAVGSGEMLGLKPFRNRRQHAL